MFFGLMNGSSTLQKMMSEVLKDLRFCRSYIDYILVFSRSEDQSVQHVAQVLKRISGSGLPIELKTCFSCDNQFDSLATLFQAKAWVTTITKPS